MMRFKSYAELREEFAAAQRTFLETDLALAATIADIAKRHHQQGNSEHGDRCKGEGTCLRIKRAQSPTQPSF